MGSHRVGHDWSDLAAAAAADKLKIHLIHTHTHTHNYKSIQRKYYKSENFLRTISTASEVRLSNLTTKALKLYNKDSTKLMEMRKYLQHKWISIIYEKSPTNIN